MSIPPSIDLSCTIKSFEEETTQAYSLIDEGVRVGCIQEKEDCRLYANDIVVDGVVTLASLNCFDAHYRVGSMYLRTRKEYCFGMWSQTSSLCGAGLAGVLGHLIRLDIAHRKDSFGLQSLAIKHALFDAPEDTKVLFCCQKIIEQTPQALIPSLEKILKRNI